MEGKLVFESVDFYLNEAEDEKKRGVIRRAGKYVATMPARALRKARAKAIMEKYKNRSFRDIDKIIAKYSSNLPKIVEKVENRIENVQKSLETSKSGKATRKSKSLSSRINLMDKGEDDIIAKRYEDISNEIRNYIEDLLRKLRDACNKVTEHYAKSISDRIERAGTITGVEFYPEDKTMLASLWKLKEDDINSYIESKLAEFIDAFDLTKMEDIKAQLSQFVEKHGRYHSSAFYDVQKETEVDLNPGDDEAVVFPAFQSMASTHGLKLYTPLAILDKSVLANFSNLYNRPLKSNPRYLQFIIYHGQLAIQLLDKSENPIELPFNIPKIKGGKGRNKVDYKELLKMILAIIGK